MRCPRWFSQAIFLLSFCEPSVQLSQVSLLRDESLAAGIDNQFRPAINGLAHIIDGRTFAADGTVPTGSGRCFLGWAVGRHWYLPVPELNQASQS
jgi:hypothetical protein